MQPVNAASWAAVELAKVERLVVVTNSLIELQRQFVEYLDQTSSDVTSAKIVFDHLVTGLSSCVARRHRLRAMTSAQANAA